MGGNELDLGPIEERLRGKTGDKWRFFVDEETHHVTFMADDFLVMDFPPGTFGGYRPYDEDREFIANAPTDIAALVAEVKRLKIELAESQENNFHWDREEQTYVCGVCGSQDRRVGGIKSHIRANHIEG